MIDRYLREPECFHVTGLSRVTRWRLEKIGKFPKRKQLSANTIGWLESEITDWLATRDERPGAVEAAACGQASEVDYTQYSADAEDFI